MRSFIRSPHHAVAPLLLSSTLVFALPQGREQLMPRDTFDPAFAFSYGSVGSTPVNTGAVDQANTSPSSTQQAATSNADVSAEVAATSLPNYDTVHETPIDSRFTTSSGSTPNPADQSMTALDVNSPISTSSSAHGTLAPAPVVTHSGISGHGVLTGIVAGGLVFGLVILTIGLWLCYRRRGPNSGASTPKYTTAVTGDEKPPSAFAFLRGGVLPWKKSQHTRVRSDMSFASPILENEPKMIETPSTSRTPLAPHLSGSTATRTDWKDQRWSTFSSSDSGSVYPQTPVNNRHLSGIIMETVVETDGASNPQTPIMAPRHDIDYLVLQRSSKDKLPPPLTTDFDPRRTPPASSRYSDEASTPTTMSSGGMTFGSAGHGSHYLRTSGPPPALPTQYSNNSGSLRSGSTGTALLNTRPKFNVTSPNGSDTVSIGNESGETLRITNPFLGDDEDGSSYGHGMLEADDLPDMDGQSMRSVDSRGHRAYPSSNGCLDPSKIAASPSPEPTTMRPRSSLISDSSSEYPYPLGYAIDSEGNVANPFLRISELLEEVDGRMRWPSPPLLRRAESRND